MDQDEFELNIVRYGTDLAAWPSQLRQNAMVSDAKHQAYLSQELKLDALLRHVIEPPAPVAEMIIARALNHSQDDAGRSAQWRKSPTGGFGLSAFLRWFDAGWMPVGALAACATLAFLIGVSEPRSDHDIGSVIEAINGMSAGSFTGGTDE